MSFPGTGGGGMGLGGMGLGGMGGGLGRPSMNLEELQQQQYIKLMQATIESCPGKLVLSGGMGFGLGGMFGLFMSSMRYDTPMSGGIGGAGAMAPSLSTREQLRLGLKDMGRSTWSSAKNFGYIGAVFAGTECVIEGFRAKNDLANGPAAGCFTGALLAKNAGPQAMAVGCAGFAAFSAAIDYYMRMPNEDRAADPII